jgi:hypothetical protein
MQTPKTSRDGSNTVAQRGADPDGADLYLMLASTFPQQLLGHSPVVRHGLLPRPTEHFRASASRLSKCQNTSATDY